MTAAATGPRLSIMPAGAVTDTRLKAQDVRVLALLGRHTDKLGWCRRSQVKMARELGCSRGTVQNALDRLCETGWVERRLEGRGSLAPDPEKQPFAAYSYRVILDRDEWPDTCGGGDDDTAEPVDAVAGGDTDGGCQPVGTGGANPEMARGANPGLARGANPGVAPLERPSLNDPLLAQAPPTPPDGGAGARAGRARTFEPPPDYSPEFLSFWSRYPGHQAMHRRKAWPVWQSMTSFDQRWAGNAVSAYGILLAQLKRKPVDAEKWLADGGFEEFTADKPKQEADPVHVFVAEGGEDWRALAVIHRVLGLPLNATVERAGKCGVLLPHPLPADALALARFTPPPLPPPFDEIGEEPLDFGGWTIVEDRTQPFGAWRARIFEWIGARLEASRIYLGGFTEHVMPALTGDKPDEPRIERFKKRKNGALVPSEWPPSKSHSKGD